MLTTHAKEVFLSLVTHEDDALCSTAQQAMTYRVTLREAVVSVFRFGSVPPCLPYQVSAPCAAFFGHLCPLLMVGSADRCQPLLCHRVSCIWPLSATGLDRLALTMRFSGSQVVRGEQSCTAFIHSRFIFTDALTILTIQKLKEVPSFLHLSVRCETERCVLAISTPDNSTMMSAK